MKAFIAIVLLSLACRGEILDRIAVTVDDIVITERDITKHLRIAAFLNEEPVVLDASTKRAAAESLVELTLVRREMEISRYPVPSAAEAEPFLERERDERFDSEDAFRAALAEYELDEDDLREGLRLQMTIDGFINFRFRPGITVTDEEVERYYQDVQVPEARRRGENAGTLDEDRDTIEEVLIGERVNEELDDWLAQAKESARVIYREEAFQ